MKRSYILLLALLAWQIPVLAGYWQQRVEYRMEVEMDLKNHRFAGYQHLRYFNNSPDTIYTVYYHLYFNAFKPGSAMDIRSRHMPDPDRRIGSKIASLKAGEQGYQKVAALRQENQALVFEVRGTIMEVTLLDPLLPGMNTILEMDFEGQVPLQVRRCGRFNQEGIDYSMAQWYPKMAEYDEDGWHLDPYISREFYGVWGSFDVKITIDSSYVVASTGYLQNPREVGHGYCKADRCARKPGQEITWHFVADSIHDFAWAADPNFRHDTYKVSGGPLLRFFHVPNDTFADQWNKLPELTAKGFDYLSSRFGKYPYGQYSVIQAGDGGMEYPMATFITGRRYLGSLFGVVMHEAAHSWYQLILGTNEARYHWMDEGFTNYAGNAAFHKVMYPNGKANPHERSFISYLNMYINASVHEPLCTHADHFLTNAGYGNAAYSKGELFLVQLQYVIGELPFENTMKAYFNKWGYRHPRPEDFIRIAEKQSGLVLDWYLDYWVHSTKHIDYAVVGLKRAQGNTYVVLERKGPMPMPVEVVVQTKEGEEFRYYVPLDIMHGMKRDMVGVAPAWMWVAPQYELKVAIPKHKIASVYLDFKGRVADVDASNDSRD